jgi:hypothetical protein
MANWKLSASAAVVNAGFWRERMKLQVTLLSAALLLGMGSACAGDSEWHFKVSNESKAKITKLQTSQDKKDWGDFDVGGGIKSGETATMIWDSSTDSEACKQWVRARFADGSSSEPSKIDFCKDLEDPIVFSD